jgi:hypothetical protein
VAELVMSEPPVIETDTIPLKFTRTTCSRCGGSRNCDIRGSYTENFEDGQFQAWKEWQILQCRGCDYVFIQTISTNSEDYDHDDDGSAVLNETKEIWPALSARRMPEWLEKSAGFNLGRELEFALSELYMALNHDLRRLAGIGIRMSFDLVSESLGIDPELVFQKKLDTLESEGFIDLVGKDRLETLISAGGASAHRGWSPRLDDLNSLMDILEHFIEVAIVEPHRREGLDAKVKKLKSGVPARKSKDSKMQ